MVEHLIAAIEPAARLCVLQENLGPKQHRRGDAALAGQGAALTRAYLLIAELEKCFEVVLVEGFVIAPHNLFQLERSNAQGSRTNPTPKHQTTTQRAMMSRADPLTIFASIPVGFTGMFQGTATNGGQPHSTQGPLHWRTRKKSGSGTCPKTNISTCSRREIRLDAARLEPVSVSKGQLKHTSDVPNSKSKLADNRTEKARPLDYPIQFPTHPESSYF